MNPNNILEIHFLMIGRKGTPYEGGHYIGKITHNSEYPLKAPEIMACTPNGRFVINKNICLTNSSYHQESWAPAAWNLLSILEGFSSVWHSDIREDKVGISHIENTPKDEIKKLAEKSISFNQQNYSHIYNDFPKIKNN